MTTEEQLQHLKDIRAALQSIKKQAVLSNAQDYRATNRDAIEKQLHVSMSLVQGLIDENGRQDSEKKPLLLDKVPSGIRQDLEMAHKGYGDWTPSIAIRHWIEIPKGQGSKSQWTCDGYASSRQYAGTIAENLFRSDHKIREVWWLRDGLNHPGPEILDYAHADFGHTFPRSLPETTPDTTMSLEEIAEFSRTWIIAYYGIHESNVEFIRLEGCEQQPLQPHLAHCKFTFSESGEQVALLWRLGKHPFVTDLKYPGQAEF